MRKGITMSQGIREPSLNPTSWRISTPATEDDLPYDDGGLSGPAHRQRQLLIDSLKRIGLSAFLTM